LSEIKIEFLIPLFYKDGSSVEEPKIMDVYDEIVKRFTACSMNNSSITGRWMNPDTKVYYDDTLRSIWVICEDNIGNRKFFQDLQERVRILFNQDSILMYITVVTTKI
jgi:hypothetical protein